MQICSVDPQRDKFPSIQEFLQYWKQIGSHWGGRSGEYIHTLGDGSVRYRHFTWHSVHVMTCEQGHCPRETAHRYAIFLVSSLSVPLDIVSRDSDRVSDEINRQSSVIDFSSVSSLTSVDGRLHSTVVRVFP